MNEDQESEFAFDFPLRVLLASPAGDPDEPGFSYTGSLCIKSKGEQCLPIFTDDDLLERFLRDYPVADDVQPVAFQYADSFLQFLKSVSESGDAAYVVFDPWKGMLVVQLPVDDFIRQLENRQST